MATIAEIAQRSQSFVDQISKKANEAVFAKSEFLLDLNRAQLINHKGNDDNPLVNNRTGNEKLSKAYAKKKGETYPTLKWDGSFHSEFVIHPAQSLGVYSVDSRHWLNRYLPNQYRNAMGIAPSNSDKAQQATGEQLAKDYFNSVFK